MENFNWLSLVYLLLVALLIGPAALSRARGSRLRYAAIWLAILVGILFVYQTFGPF